MSAPVDVFISYSPKDAELRAELEDHLMALKRKGVIRIWHDQLIGPGQDWRAVNDEHLRSARVILLLISSNFLGSDYCYDIEMRNALERSRRGEACVIPVLLRACDLTDAPFSGLRMLPEGKIPVTSPPWANHHEAWQSVARGIREAILILERGTTMAPMEAPPWEGAPATKLVLMAPPVEPRSQPRVPLSSRQVAPTALQTYYPPDPASTPVPSSPFGAGSSRQRQSHGIPQSRGARGQWQIKAALAVATIFVVAATSTFILQTSSPPPSPSSPNPWVAPTNTTSPNPWVALPNSTSPNSGSGAPDPTATDMPASDLVSLEWGPGYTPCVTVEPVILFVANNQCGQKRSLEWLQRELAVLRSKGVPCLSDLPASFVLQTHGNEQGVQNWYLNIYAASSPGVRPLRNLIIGGGVIRVTNLISRGQSVVLAYGIDGSWRFVHQGQAGQPFYERIR